MTVVAYYLLKVVICSGILFLYYHLALRNKVFHQWNRFFLLFAVFASVLLPFLQVTLSLGASEPNGAIRLVKTVQSADAFLEEIVVVGYRTSTPEQWFFLLYGAVCLVLLIGFILSLRKIFAIIRSHGITVLDKIKFVNTTADGTPFSFLNYIVWNKNISLQSATGQQIFQHELVHVEEKHTIDKLLLQVVLILFWCNPFFWLIRKELRFIHEFIADEKAVAEHGTAAFAAMILNAAYPQQFQTLTNPFFQSPIKRRLTMLSKLQKPKLNYISRLIALPVIAITVFAFTLRVDPVANAALAQDFVVVIDAGHGKTAAGNFSGAHTNDVYEDALVLAVSKKIQALNTNNRIKVVLSRPSDEIIGLKERVALAEAEHADLFLSLHMNAVEAGASSTQRTSGFEVFLASKSTPYQRQSELFGSALQQQLKTAYETYPGLLQANAWVLNQNVCPSAMVQIGYVTNEQDRRFISSEANQKLIAAKVLAAINQYAANQQQQASATSLKDTVPSAREIVSVDVKKEQQTITLTYRDGTKETLTREQAIERKLLTEKGAKEQPVVKEPGTTKPKPLYMVNDKEYTGNINDIDPNTIEQINVLKDESAVDKYGSKGKNGVVEITLKGSKPQSKSPVVKNSNTEGNDVQMNDPSHGNGDERIQEQ